MFRQIWSVVRARYPSRWGAFFVVVFMIGTLILVGAVLVIGGAAGVFFSLFGWRRTLKPALTLGLVLAALAACGLWSQQLPIETVWRGPWRALLPAWASFLRWQVLLLVLLLALLPIVALWNQSVRRLPGPEQLMANAAGAVIGALVLAAGVLALP
jgi:lipid A ethanolaminephosphotransferase